ncbi:metallophosphoesterase family protein [Gimesia fumaroli]|uniref:Putative metallophosphoesterase YhaO n=1 Tax=Gimesia fumaroli TaxID=2527976 RepID=A0A518IKB7_9PLAN|nr:hypothetical protein [Gimesia fumaroli]QDV53485.1 putative metallophosphoesterase YhaO [Gimesia fumaroli]
MPFVPTRFIHASNLRLDHQPQGVGAVSKESQISLEDCTLLTFQEIVKACLEHEIDFLLLTGNTFINEDHSIRARIALLDGFQQLASENIQVFVIPGKHDPLSAWDLHSNWPANVTFLSPQDHDTLDILRNEETIATLQVLGAANYKKQQPLKLKQRNQLFNQRDQRALSIGLISANLPVQTADQYGDSNQSIALELTSEFQAANWQSDESNEVTVDYLALCKGTQRHTFEMHPGLAHHPGTSQGLNYDEHKQTGVTLVTVEPQAQLDLRLLKVAAVRWLMIELDLEPETTPQQLKQLMKEALLSRKAARHETLWMVRWLIKGSGELFDSLDSFKRQSSWSSELALEIKDRLPVMLEQAFYLQYRDAYSNRSASDLMHRFQQQIEAFKRETESPLKHLVTHTTQLDQTWHERLGSLTEQMNEQTIFNSAIRNGQTWLNITSDEEVHS